MVNSERPHTHGPPPQRDLRATYEGVLAVAASSVAADAAALYLLDLDEGDLRLVAARGVPDDALGHRLAPGEGLIGRVVSEDRSLIADDVALDPRAVRRRADWDRDPQSHSFLGVPLRAGSMVLGAIELTRRSVRPFTTEERGRATIMAESVALLIEQERLAAQPPPAALGATPMVEEDPLGIVTVDGQLRIASANPGFTRLVQMSVEALIGRPIIAILASLGRPRARDALEAALHGASGHLGGVRMSTPEGAESVLSISLIPLGSPSRGVDGVLLALLDVSERSRLEAELREQHARSLEARDRLRAVIEVVTHELRTPLTSVLGYARLLHDRPNAAEERRVHWAALVTDKARLMARQVDEVTDVARLGSAQFALERTPTDVGALVSRVASEFADTCASHTFKLNVMPELPAVGVDRDRIEQVLTNLLANAVKYWPDGGEIALSVVRDPSGVRVEVADRGPGVSPETADRLFEPFYRGTDEHTRAVPGTGLGLTVSRGIVEAHGGHMWVDPTPGGGATFRFTLPVGSAHA